MMIEEKFDGDHWAWKALEDFVAFKDMYGYVTNQSAMDSHKDSMTYFTIDPNLHHPDSASDLRNHAEKSLKSSLNHFAAQTLVSLCTTYEVALKQFFKCLFIKHPNYMHDYVGSKDGRGTVQLKELVDSGDYMGFISSLAEKASSVASKGKYKESLKRAVSICKYNQAETIFDGIKEMQEIRNRIVHEKYLPSLDIDDLQRFHSVLSSVIESLCHMGIKKGLPGRYTYVKPGTTFELKSFATVTVDNA
ncbi:hypothetical protein ACJJH9_03870 [Microbulbifer sp. DLAB2-AF]|uniref:hypothetical protein n=1 Tax=Microbulbifer sp. DLAB2-AF TaxID=3243395 RepID=UPI00403955DD